MPIAAGHRGAMERFCRYALRGPIANGGLAGRTDDDAPVFVPAPEPTPDQMRWLSEQVAKWAGRIVERPPSKESLALDGVDVPGPTDDAPAAFLPAPEPTPDQVRWLCEQVATRAWRLVKRRPWQEPPEERVTPLFKLLGFPEGFDYRAMTKDATFEMGAELPLASKPVLHVTMPKLAHLSEKRAASALEIRLLRAKFDGWEQVATDPKDVTFTPTVAGAYRAEVRMVPHHLRDELYDEAERLLARDSVWIDSNAIDVRCSEARRPSGSRAGPVTSTPSLSPELPVAPPRLVCARVPPPRRPLRPRRAGRTALWQRRCRLRGGLR